MSRPRRTDPAQILLRGSALLWSCVAGAIATGATSALADGPPMRLSNMIFLASSQDVTEVRVVADTAVIDDAANKAQLATVQAEWAGADGKPSLDLTCERGELDLATNDLLATGNVHGRLADGRLFSGPSLRYDRARGLAYTDAPVEIIEDDRVLTGHGFQYRVRDGRLRLTGGARVLESQTP